MRWLPREIRQGVRSLARKPFFTLFAILILALAVGVNTAVFSLVDALLFKGVPAVVDSSTPTTAVPGPICCQTHNFVGFLWDKRPWLL